MIEIIEHQIDVANSDACSYFLKDLADSNEASSLRIMESSHVIVNVHHDDDENNGETNRMTWFPNLSLPASPSTNEQCCCACIARGSQKVVTARGGEVAGVGGKDGPFANNNNNDASSHWIDVDICVLRLPVVQTDLLITLSTPQQKQLRRQQQKQNDVIQSDADVGSAELYSPLFRQVLHTFHIKDWSLFASC